MSNYPRISSLGRRPMISSKHTGKHKLCIDSKLGIYWEVYPQPSADASVIQACLLNQLDRAKDMARRAQRAASLTYTYHLDQMNHKNPRLRGAAEQCATQYVPASTTSSAQSKPLIYHGTLRGHAIITQDNLFWRTFYRIWSML